ncbi:MAG: toprim domain-containing protein [Brachymonas denitrificans]|uniref:toprim domain-containing protein n=1 Tax=Brachymonas denitrificans TaxID=28220 RepID=UPI00352D9694
MGYYRGQASAMLLDSQQHGPEAELLLVEGESAAQSVAAVRQSLRQAVLPLQGKPLNAWRASERKVAESPLFGQLAQALGLSGATAHAGGDVLPDLRFARLVLLFDPDADGIHIGALVLLYLQRWLPQLLREERVWMVRPPLGAVRWTDGETGEILLQQAYTQPQLPLLRQQALESGGLDVQQFVYRGLGSLPQQVLFDTCVQAGTRHAHVVRETDLRAVIEVFGGV